MALSREGLHAESDRHLVSNASLQSRKKSLNNKSPERCPCPCRNQLPFESPPRHRFGERMSPLLSIPAVNIPTFSVNFMSHVDFVYLLSFVSIPTSFLAKALRACSLISRSEDVTYLCRVFIRRLFSMGPHSAVGVTPCTRSTLPSSSRSSW